MKFIRPTPITGAVLTSSNVPETDYPAWSAGTAYAVGARIIRTSTHSVYERAVAGTTATAPESDSINWVRVGPTNRWAMFDEKSGTVTTRADTITVVLAPGRVNSLALLGVDAAEIAVSLEVDGDVVYAATLDLDSGNSVGDWYEYFYEPIYSQTEVVLTDLLDAALMSVPGYGEGVLTVTLSRTGANVSCGMLVVGIVSEVGITQPGVEVSIRDYSRKEADGFGNFTLVQRDYSKRMSAEVVVMADKVDNITRNVTRYRATNVVWIGSIRYGCHIVFGFLADWSLVTENTRFSRFRCQIEGMT